MTVYQWLMLFGIPSLCVTATLGIFKYLKQEQKHKNEEMQAVKSGIQALLRTQMISDYNKYMEKGEAPIYAKENFENCWRQYHSLGVNGVMDGIHKEFMSIPTSKH